MSQPQVELELAGDRRQYQPGETLSGHYRLLGVTAREVRAVELSVLWYTEGTGDEDLAVHFFDRFEPATRAIEVCQPQYFGTQLPASPLSYAGQIVKIFWCVRARVFFTQGKDLMVELPIVLGAVAAAKEVEE
ncbi:MAG TPA: hypothetical protein VMF30_16310 [Pirellulales bacterium]|nr:hypothetical protein [Pirellulales bacterium]